MAVKAPSGVTIQRNGNNFIVTWKKGSSYSAQNMVYTKNLKWAGRTKVGGVGKNTTSKTITLNLNDYYPKKDFKLTTLTAYINGKSGRKWSAYSKKAFNFSVPPKPEIVANHTDEFENRTTFAWDIDWNTTGTKDKNTTGAIFTNYQWWTSLLKDSELDSDQVTDWQETGTTTDNADSSDKQIDETEVFNDNYSYTRYFKIVARGPAGDSKPSYAKHVYAFPNPAKNVKAYATKLENGLGYRVSVSWTLDESKSRPVDVLSVEYAVATPQSSYVDEGGIRKAKLSVPDISNWTSVATLKDTTDKNGDVDGAAFIIDGEIPFDNCIFVRVVTQHDKKLTPSDAVFVAGGYGLLSAPTNLSAVINGSLANLTVSNDSALTASFVGIYYRDDADPTPQLVGVWPSRQASSISIQLPKSGDVNTISLGARTFLANYSPITPAASGVTKYAISDQIMASSGIVWDERGVPKPPSKIELSSPRTGVVRVTWNWTWTSANGVELSWASHDDAWESTEEPQTYVLENTRASAWNVSGLEVGTWYFRVRLFKVDGDATTYGTYSDIKSIKIASSPPTPVLTLSPTVVKPGDKVTCYWAFTAADGDEQVQADICEATKDADGNVTYGTILAKAQNEQYKTFDIPSSWSAGSTHYLAVRIITASGEESNNWSIPKTIQILEPITASIVSTSLEQKTIVDDEEQSISHTEQCLTAMPLSVKAIGAGESGRITYILERAEDYHLYRPDENDFYGYRGETVALIQKSATNTDGEDPDYSITINQSDLIGSLDDGARYNLIAIAQDSNGQTAETTTSFIVKWDHQAVIPSAEISISANDLVAIIKPLAPLEGFETGDVCDIYRLSIDKPELIVPDAEFGTTYVDPYPALGVMGGHRIVYKTANGDYITADNEFAWTDYNLENGDVLNLFATIIDFDDDQVILPYDISLSNKWSKDFTQTKYLGGSIEGDWNPAVERTGSISTKISVQNNPDLLIAMRRLAGFAGICHVRTPDGSSFAANVDVNEDREERKVNMIASFSLDITRIDSSGFDGLTYEEWTNENE